MSFHIIVCTFTMNKLMCHVQFQCQPQQVTTYTPDEFTAEYLNGTLGLFDAMVSFSSLEHSGLGRYDDAFNPWGDRITMARCDRFK